MENSSWSIMEAERPSDHVLRSYDWARKKIVEFQVSVCLMSEARAEVDLSVFYLSYERFYTGREVYQFKGSSNGVWKLTKI